MHGPDYWDEINANIKKHYYQKLMYSYKLDSYLRLFERWGIDFRNKTVLITDLFDESFSEKNLFNSIKTGHNRVIGVDISEVIVERAKKKTGFKDGVIADIKNLPFKNEMFDIIVSPSTLDHMPCKFLKGYLEELSRVLKKDGKILITMHNKNNIYLDFFLISILNVHKFEFEKYDTKNFNKIASDAALNINRSSSIIHLPFPSFASVILGRMDSNTFFGKKFLPFLLNFEKIGDTKPFSHTGQLLAFELNKA